MRLKKRPPEPYSAYEVKTWMRTQVLYHPDDYKTGGVLDTRHLVRRAVAAGYVTPDAMTHYAHSAWDLAESVVSWYHGLQADNAVYSFSDDGWRARAR